MPLPAGTKHTVVGVDVGGTFTDVVTHGPEGLAVLKLPTTADPSKAVLEGLRRLGPKVREVSLISHATTLATNALLTRSGLARTALITNEGFRDVLEIGRQRRPELYDLATRRPAPMIQRKDRFTVKCRITADGAELESLDRGGALSISRRIVGGGYESVAISFLNSYLNGKHEREMRSVLLKMGFRGHISISSEIDREYREYERTSTTAVNAVLAPLMTGYLSRLKSSLRRMKLDAPVYVMGSDGGACTISFASRRPVAVIESGPSAGVVGSRYLAKELHLDRVLTFDMGGTTAKAGTVIDGEPDTVNEFEAAGKTHSGRSIKGSGYAIRGEFIDLAEVSAGGGTIAWLDEAGELRVGPTSAGSDPGPACYGRGGVESTVTDANVALGRLNPVALLGGAMRIRRDLSIRSLRKLAVRLKQDVDGVSRGILRLANDGMARAISMVSVERGRDPRDFVLFAFGGAGPVHACDLAEELGVRRIIVPTHAGLFSALGLLVGDFTRTFTAPIMRTDPALRRDFEELERVLRKEMREDGFAGFTTKRYFEARYKGQSHELLLPYGSDSNLRDSFDSAHRALYGYSTSDSLEVVNIKVRAIVPRPVGGRPRPALAQNRQPKAERDAWVGGREQRVGVLTREGLSPGTRGRGPSIIEEYDSTLVVNPSWRWRIEEYGTVLTR